MAKRSTTTSRPTRPIGAFQEPLRLRATCNARLLQLLTSLVPLSVLLALVFMARAVEVAAGLGCPTFPPMKWHSLCVCITHFCMQLSNTIRFQMSGLNHTKYAQAVKQFQIRGIVLANANQGELSAIFRYETRRYHQT